MEKDLHAVIRLHKFEVDEKRRAMGHLLRQESEIISRQDGLEAEQLNEMKVAAESEDAGFSYGAYYKRYQMNRDALKQMKLDIQGQIDTAQEELAESFKELKTLEISQESRDKRAEEDRNRKEQIILDEIAMNLHRRKKQGFD